WVSSLCNLGVRVMPSNARSSWWRCGTVGDLHSLPTRRSSDLFEPWRGKDICTRPVAARAITPPGACWPWHSESRAPTPFSKRWRSEEHTSELQSRENLVCRLLLEKKKGNSPDNKRRPQQNR